MKKIRLGNDIQFNWSLLNSEGEPYNLEGADLRITYTTFRGVTEVTDFSVSGNVVSWTFKGKDQKVLGDYIVTLQQNAGEDNMLTVDKCDAFRLVARSCDAGGETSCSHLQIETIDITSTLDVQQIATGGTAKWDEIEGKPDNFADWNAEEGDEKFIANKPTIPSKTSELQNDSNFATKEEIPDTSTFITNTVNNLVNYYLKEETYTKQEVVALINQITTINFKVVDVLPDTGESNLIYLVKKEGSDDDVHDEYIWVEEKWEKIGSTSVDLTNYYTKTDADGRFALKTSIADMLTKTEAKNTYQLIGDYATKEELENATPSIGENGNWIVGGKDTGKPSRGADGVSLGEIALEQTTGSNQNAVMSQAAVTEALNKKPAGGYNRSLFEAAGAVYNEETGFYEFNELTDITEEEMGKIYKYGFCLDYHSLNRYFIFNKHELRTATIDIQERLTNFNAENIFHQGSGFITINWKVSTSATSYDGTFSNNEYLRKIIGVVDLGNSTTNNNILASSKRIESFKFKNMKFTLGKISSEFVTYESYKFLIDNAANTSAITITVHPTTYSYLTGTAEPTEQVGGTAEEWQALVTTAAEKQISFATE